MPENVLAMESKKMSVQTEVNVKKVAKVWKESPSASVQQVAQKVNISKSMVHQIMKSYVVLFPYKIQINQPFTKLDGLRRFNFANMMISKVEDAELDFN